MWYIPDDQVVKIQNRMSDIREISFKDSAKFMAATFELLGTLDTVLFDQRNWERKKKETTIIGEERKPYKKERPERTEKKDNEEHKPNSHERRKERRRLEREEAKKIAEEKKEQTPEVTENKEETNE